MGKKDKISKIIEMLLNEYPDAKTALLYNSPMEILVATILSAQCTDERVNKVTNELFKKYKSVKDYANADLTVFQNEIRSTGFFRNKAKNIIEAAKKILEKYDGKVPNDMNELLTLPGVARKTANVVLFAAFNKAVGIVVDTHIKRVSYRIGLTDETAPEKIEKDLMEITDKKFWIKISFLLINHGRKICSAHSPKCNLCKISLYCDKRGISQK